MEKREITFGVGIRGTLCVPRSTPAPTAILLHGFASDRNEVGNLFAETAASLAQSGIASIRLDFRGWGESAGEMADCTLDSQIDDCAVAWEYIAEQDVCDIQRVGVLGFSLGGAVALLSAARHPRRYRSLVLWSCDADLVEVFKEELGPEAFEEAEKKGVVTCVLPWGREVTLGVGFFRSLCCHDPLEAVRLHRGALLAVAGGGDSSASSVDSYVQNCGGAPKKAVVLPGANHIFGVFNEDQQWAEETVSRTVRWFSETL